MGRRSSKVAIPRRSPRNCSARSSRGIPALYFASYVLVHPAPSTARSTMPRPSDLWLRVVIGILPSPLLDASIPVGSRIDLLLATVPAGHQARPIGPVKNLSNDLSARCLVRLECAFPVVSGKLLCCSAGLAPIELAAPPGADAYQDGEQQSAGYAISVH